MRSPGHLPNASVMLYESIVLRARELTCKQLKIWNPWSRTGSNKTCALPNSIRWFHISKSTHSTNNCGRIKYVKCMVWCSLSKFQKGGSLLKFDSFCCFNFYCLNACMHAALAFGAPSLSKAIPTSSALRAMGKNPVFFFELAKLHSESFFDSKYVCCSAVLPQSGPAIHPPCRPGWPTRARCPGRNPRAASIVPGEENNGKVAFSQTSISINQERFGFSRSIIQTCEKPKTSKRNTIEYLKGSDLGTVASPNLHPLMSCSAWVIGRPWFFSHKFLRRFLRNRWMMQKLLTSICQPSSCGTEPQN